MRLASLDVEWTKNRRIKNGNKPFCFSLVWMDLPRRGPVALPASGYGFTSVYVEDPQEVGALMELAGRAVRSALDGADYLVGHQLCADLGVLTAHAAPPPVTEAREAWRRRRTPQDSDPHILDTRYDAGHLLAQASRRLVDVCTELQLDVTQPELRSTSMTALHRRWLEKDDATARERISVLNLRHSLSTAFVAARAAGLATWSRPVNVNRILAHGATGAWPWLNSPTFTALLEEPCPSAPARS
ncbi:hypothetical protein GCM10009760_16520 [Kitasatospora kazusensis]|uniref:Uncharacterized protein n=1 Tax=Kitasatospora kazusensis TaxID=407974 RepID=A0ABN2Z4S7_9ACTN